MARPTDYNDNILLSAKDYANNWKTIDPEDKIPTIEGLALHLNINRDTIYDWSSQETKQEFSDIVKQVMQKQAKTLVNKGLSNEFNSAITKVMLSKHGYREGIEQMGKDGKDLIPTLTEEKKKELISILDEPKSTN